MAAPESVRQARTEYIQDQNLADLTEASAWDNGGSMYGLIPKTFVKTYDIQKGDAMRTFADFQNDVLLQTPADLLEESER